MGFINNFLVQWLREISMKTRPEEAFNLSALYLHRYNKVYFSLLTLSRYLCLAVKLTGF